MTEESKSLSSNTLTVSPPKAANNDIDGSKRFVTDVTELKISKDDGILL